tara:strand:- start:2001 stop:2267 length:267 start_codon:yes stop_codon:yes gene_type:complete
MALVIFAGVAGGVVCVVIGVVVFDVTGAAEVAGATVDAPRSLFLLEHPTVRVAANARVRIVIVVLFFTATSKLSHLLYGPNHMKPTRV